MASAGGEAAGPLVAVAVAVSGSRSRRAVLWAAENLIPDARRVLLLHVIPPLSAIPDPLGAAGRLVPIERVNSEAAVTYDRDRRLQAVEDVLPFKKLCRTKKEVEISVFDGHNTADTLLKYASESGIENLVLGGSSWAWLRRILKAPDVATTILRSAPSSFNIFVVTRHSVMVKRAHQSVNSAHSGNSFVVGNLKYQDPDEVEKLRLELQNTLAMYNRACEDLVHARQKVQMLSAECSEESRKVTDALQREEVFKRIAAEEKAKHLKALMEVQEARQLLAKETMDRHRAEIDATKESSEKLKMVDAFFSSDKRYRKYSRNEIEVATGNFSADKKIGEGGFGNVYKGILDHTPVAVKVLREDAIERQKEFLKEVEVLSQLHHPHMLLLLGACPEIGCLVYEYMENGSLEDRLFCRGRTPPLPWFVRLRIIFEVACGLAFLHGSKPEPIVHRDLKPGNILLDRNYVSKIGDVGLAKLMSNVVPEGVTEYTETVLAGTLYYMDPEYQRTGTLRPKSDLFAFGIVVLQLLTGRPPRGLLVTVEEAISSGTFVSILDKSISDWPIAESQKLAQMALRCTQLKCRDRPDLESEVIPELEELSKMADNFSKSRQSHINAPAHFFCPILEALMDDPYIAADGFSYEYVAIKAWFEKHSISPVTRFKLQHTAIIPNHSLRAAIQEWKSGLIGCHP
ncbi:hypothetical protein Taro_027091 [Colocasia esculenta]|uniref:RING-type E3 ubiquitin transferase n=1 Tax=Colocasia esculenta TaxID=4460 RepID=A0A843VH29_COLES|nr:hypothetical protein [Colocasia esculenta]